MDAILQSVSANGTVLSRFIKEANCLFVKPRKPAIVSSTYQC